VSRENYYPSKIAAPILTEMCLEFFTILQSEGYYTGLYVNNEFLNNILQTENMIELFEIWYARYPASSDSQWDVEKYGAHLGMWQYSDKGSFASVPDSPLDLNYAYKDYPTLIRQYGFNGYSAEE
jgi:GH25 family lysozyme M1 (1,4-beta-N-acetylmuramidase)